MSKFLQSLLSLIRPRGKDDDNSKQQQYDPRCGMSREEYEWRCAQAETVNQCMPQMLEKLDVLFETTRPHFQDDPGALNQWDEYENDVRHMFKNNLHHTLAAPLYLPNSVTYEHLMQRQVWSRTLVGRVSVGLEKLKQAATKPTKRNKRSVRPGVIAAGVAVGVTAAFAVGIAAGRSQLHESSKQKTNETKPIASN